MKKLLFILLLTTTLFSCGKSNRMTTEYKVVGTAFEPLSMTVYTNSLGSETKFVEPGSNTIEISWADKKRAKIVVDFSHVGDETVKGKIEVYKKGTLIGTAEGNNPRIVVENGYK